MKLIIPLILLCTWNALADDLAKRSAHRPAPMMAIYGSGKTIFKEHPSGRIEVVHQSLARQGRGRFAQRGYGWTRSKDLHLPAWASKAVILLPFGSRLPIVNRRGTVRTGSKLYHVVKITQVQSTEKLEELAQQVIQFLFDKQVINAQVGAKIIHTFALKPFGVFTAQPNEVLHLDTAKTLTLKGLIKARNRFVRGLRQLISYPGNQASKAKVLVKLLLTLALDNEYYRIPVAIEAATKYGVQIQVTGRSQGLSFVHKQGRARFINIVKTIQGTPSNLTTLAHHLATVLTKGRILDAEFVRQFFATYSVTPKDDSGEKAEALTEEDLKDIESIHGRPLVRRRFLHDLRLFVTQKQQKSEAERLEQVVRLLTRLVIGNGMRRAKQFENFAHKKFGVFIEIQRQLPDFKEQPWLKPKHPIRPVPVQSLVYFHKVFYLNTIPKDKSAIYIQKLLELLIQGGVIDLNFAQTFLATFDVKAAGKFEKTPELKRWTPETMDTFKMEGNHFSKGNFLNIILQLLLLKQKPKSDNTIDILSRSLLELSLDNNIINIKNATELGLSNDIKLICRKLPAPPPKPDEIAFNEAAEESEEEEEEEGPIEGVIIHDLLDHPAPELPQQKPSENPVPKIEPPKEEQEEEEEELSASESDSSESKSGDSSDSESNEDSETPPAGAVETDDDDDENIKPEKVIDSIVSIIDSAPEKRVAFILRILDILAEKELLSRNAAARILATFEIDSGDNFPKDQKSVDQYTVDELNVDGTNEAREKFTTVLLQLLDPEQEQSERLSVLLKILLEFAIDNRAILNDDAEQLAKKYGYSISVEIKKMKAELETNLNLGQQAAFGVKYLSKVQLEDYHGQKHLLYADNALAILVDNALIPAQTAVNLLRSFGFTGTSRYGDIESGKILDKNSLSSLQVVSDPDAKKKFLETLDKNIANPNPSQLDLINQAVELALENAVIDIHAAAKLAVQFGYSVTIKIVNISSPSGQTDGKHNSQVQITGSYSDDLSPLLNLIASKLSAAKVLDAKDSNNIFSTFGVSKATGTAIETEKISELPVKGDKNAKTKFLSGLKSFLNKNAAKDKTSKEQAEKEYDLTVLLKHYLELLLDNKGIPAQECAQTVVPYGVSISIQEILPSETTGKII